MPQLFKNETLRETQLRLDHYRRQDLEVANQALASANLRRVSEEEVRSIEKLLIVGSHAGRVGKP
jgi:hypothetical protein